MRPQRPEAEAEAERAPDRGPVPVLPRVRAFRASAFASPDLLCERLRAAGVAGCSLLARRLANGGTTTLVAARGLLRAELRGDKVTITAL
ncbi:MAG: hypothetical protein KDE27_19545, partial [Planctomycetes bacterium]|nr:hypothetical protein [Planctomycetota bacterium]